jgi:colanic acid/amylovoran biosynthesis glycosyltransferase
MRIAYLINEYPKVSHTFIRREIRALERRGFEIVRIALRGWNQDLADSEDQLERERTWFVLREGTPALLLAVTQMLLTRPVYLFRAMTLACRMGRRAERPLPVHLAYLAEACRIELWLRGKGIQHLHAHFSTNSAEVAMLVHALGGPQWSFTAHGAATLENPTLIGLLEKVRRCAFVVTVCSFGRGQVWRFADQQDRARVHVVHCGLDSTFFKAPMRPAPAVRRLVCVGRLCKEKAHFLLLEAARRLAAQGADFELVLAGDGELRAEIVGLIELYNLRLKVRITGWISSEQVRNEILASRALVLPSLIEGLPVVIMEAMALRRPVISTFVAGIPELVQPGEHGWLVPAGDVDALVEAMRACLDAPASVLSHMGEAAHMRVLERHNVDTEAGKLAQLFEAAVKG